MSAPQHDRSETISEFHHLVNMPPATLGRWLESPESRSVGMTHDGERVTHEDGPESVGHHMGGEIMAIREKRQADLDDTDLAAMRKVIGYIHRHMAQRPSGDVTGTRWHHSLLNWGHDPLKA